MVDRPVLHWLAGGLLLGGLLLQLVILPRLGVST